MEKDYLNSCNRGVFILHTISKELQSSIDVDQIIHVALTGITAGYFLGFSRAFVLFYEKEKNLLIGKRGIGPFDEYEAGLIWSKLEKENLPVEEYFRNGEKEHFKNSRFNLEIEKLRINIDDLPEDDYIKRVIKERKIYVCYNAEKETNLPPSIKFLLHPSDLVIVPLSSEEDLIGVIFADNSFHRNPITEETLMFLSLISFHTALALKNAFKYIEIKNMHEELVKKEKFAIIGRFSSYITHQIKNPLVVIGGFSKQILETDDLNKIKRNAKIIYEEILHLEKVLDNIVKLTNIPKIPIVERVNVSEIIIDVVGLLLDEAKEKKIKIKVSVPEFCIKGDSILLREAFFNIIKNSIEHNIEGGEINITGERTEEFFKITVRDTGIGIKEEFLKKVTEPFFTTKDKGIGLGLTIAKEVIERHNGKIEIESKVNCGTSVFVYLPWR